MLGENTGIPHTSNISTPLVIDLDGDGVETLGVDRGVQFDLTNKGNAQQTGWVGADDGLLVLDLNQNGAIDNGAELFGDATVLTGGDKAKDGFAALAQYDENQDGVVDADDSVYAKLGVWQDKNSDGQTQAGELKSLVEHGLVSLSLKAIESDIDSNDNQIGLQSSATKANGESVELADVWFRWEGH